MTLIMKSEITYTLKVCLTALIASLPATLVIGWAYIGIVMLVKPENYYFNFNLSLSDLCIFISITAVLVFASLYSITRSGHRKFVNDRPIVYSIVIFVVYLLLSKTLASMSIGGLLFSYCPMFFITYLCHKIFSKYKNKAELGFFEH